MVLTGIAVTIMRASLGLYNTQFNTTVGAELGGTQGGSGMACLRHQLLLSLAKRKCGFPKSPRADLPAAIRSRNLLERGVGLLTATVRGTICLLPSYCTQVRTYVTVTAYSFGWGETESTWYVAH
jgi:hypothetical protein